MKKNINRTKRAKWKELCKELEEDVWGQGYHIAMRSLNAGKVPYSLPKTQKKIAEDLFPSTDDFRARRERENEESIVPFTGEELREVERKIKSCKAPGMDEVPSEAVKIILQEIPEEVLRVLNESLKKQEFPEKWKAAKVVLIIKKGKPVEESASYRPICMLDGLGKVYEAMIRDRIAEELKNKRGISQDQYGFTKGKSTIQALNKIRDHVKGTRAVWVLLVTLDIKNAFNTARWSKIIAAMEKKKISRYLINIVDSYLSDRKIYYTNRDDINAKQGVPQGSVLGPTLWNILYDDVLRIDMEEDVWRIAFADDLVIMTQANSKRNLMDKTNRALE